MRIPLKFLQATCLCFLLVVVYIAYFGEYFVAYHNERLTEKAIVDSLIDTDDDTENKLSDRDLSSEILRLGALVDQQQAVGHDKEVASVDFNSPNVLVQPDSTYNDADVDADADADIPSDSDGESCEKWIVITTINAPNDNIKYMHDAFYGWCVLVVADRKTPASWSYRRVRVLSVLAQVRMSRKYELARLLPYNTYARKMLGYLYAIEHGARFIYETDDDNLPSDGLFGFRYERFKGLEQHCSPEATDDSLFINPYAYFGQPSMWPRGFPLEHITDDDNATACSTFQLYTVDDAFVEAQPDASDHNPFEIRPEDRTDDFKQRVPLIQQGLVNGDPDVDAIYRMTRNQFGGLNVTFDASAPPLVLKRRHEYAPLNSQNTFYHQDAFFTLALPLNVTFRECDIVRGYMAVRLLHEINGRVAFMPPNAVQVRNQHSYHADYLDERRLYERVSELARVLDAWSCGEASAAAGRHSQSVRACVLECVQLLQLHGFLDASETRLYAAWLADLDTAGYRWPRRNQREPRVNVHYERRVRPVHYRTHEQAHSATNGVNELSARIIDARQRQRARRRAFCQLPEEPVHDDDAVAAGDIAADCQLDKVVLVTAVASEVDLDTAWSLFGPHFANVVVCVSAPDATTNGSNSSSVDNSSSSKSAFFQTYTRESAGGLMIIEGHVRFSTCVGQALQVGMRQQAFLVEHNYARLVQLWAGNVSFEQVPPSTLNSSTSDKADGERQRQVSLLEEALNSDAKSRAMFTRLNVANGLRFVNYGGDIVDDALPPSELFCGGGGERVATEQNAGRRNGSTTMCAAFERAIDELHWHANDLVSESCERLASRTYWIPGFHDGPRVDLTSILVRLGQKPILAGYKGDSSPYPDALRLGRVSYDLSNFIAGYQAVNYRGVADAAVRENYEHYNRSGDFAGVDAVVCSFLASLCEAFMPLNKTILFNPAQRYNIGRCSNQSWLKLNDNYARLRARGKLLVGAMSRYDAEYQAHFTGLRGYRLYAYGGFYAPAHMVYSPTRPEILVGPTSHLGRIGGTLLAELQQLAQPLGLHFEHVRTVYAHHYTLEELASHRAIVLLPYAVMSYSIIDYYISGLPIFVPTVDLITSWKNLNDRTIRFVFYCGHDAPDIEPHADTAHPYNPNDDAEAAYSYWAQFADYYHWPFVSQFESWTDLIHKLNTLDLHAISRNMKRFNENRQNDVLDQWCKVVHNTPPNPPIPHTYQQALDYFNVTEFQVN